MKVVNINKSDREGGAAKGAYRVHSGLRKIGIDSKMVVDNKISDDPNVIGGRGKLNNMKIRLRSFCDKLPLWQYTLKNPYVHTGNMGKDPTKIDIVRQADIINLYWVGGGFVSLEQLSKLGDMGKPIVWKLSDMWAFTGGCHYSGECDRYLHSCGSCPQLDSINDNDISRKVWKKKKKVYSGLKMTIVTPSKWLGECAKQSPLLSGFEVRIIPNGLETDVFKPKDMGVARDAFNLPGDKKIIMFGSMNADTDKRKGFHYLKQSLKILPEMEDIKSDKLCLAVFGASESKDIAEFPFEVRFLGKIDRDSSLALAYSAADVFVLPSLQDNSPLTVLESLACGTPVVGFDVGGIPDIVEHKVNGYLASYKDPSSLAEGIKWTLEDEERNRQLRSEARKKITENHTLEIQARNYKDLYGELLK